MIGVRWVFCLYISNPNTVPEIFSAQSVFIEGKNKNINFLFVPELNTDGHKTKTSVGPNYYIYEVIL